MVNKLTFFALALLLSVIVGCVDESSENKDSPTQLSPGDSDTFVGKMKDIVVGEKLSPPDRIKTEQIHVYEDKVVIDIKNPRWTEFEDTDSMDPLLDVGANAIQIIPESEDEIYLGDIVVYESNYYKKPIIHRIVDIGEDKKGKYFILKGDNNPVRDPGKVRFEQIKRVLVGIIY